MAETEEVNLFSFIRGNVALLNLQGILQITARKQSISRQASQKSLSLPQTGELHLQDGLALCRNLEIHLRAVLEAVSILLLRMIHVLNHLARGNVFLKVTK